MRAVAAVGAVCGVSWVKRQRRPKGPAPDAPALSIVDLFCGCGGLTLGAHEAARRNGRRVNVRLAVDTSAEALSVYRHNFGVSHTRAIEKEIEVLFPGEVGEALSSGEQALRKSVGEVDLVLAGPPCQGHSDLNNSTRRNDPRNALYLRVIRAVEVLQPRAVLVENVPAVVHDRGDVLTTSLAALDKLEYECSQKVVDIAHLGIPQRRRRHILLALRGEKLDLKGLLASHRKRIVPVSKYLGGIEDEPDLRPEIFYQPSSPSDSNKRRIAHLFDNDVHDLPDRLRPACHRDKAHTYVSMYGRMYWTKPAGTITSGFGSMGQGRFVHPTRPRTLTPHESARIQGFPDFFDFSMVEKRTALREMIGNAVPPRLAAVVISALLSEGRL